MKLRYIFAIVMLWSLNCFAQEGASAYSFLEVPSSSHAFALGGANITVIDDDINLMEQNPALLGPEIDMQVGFNYMHYLGASNFAGVRYGMAAGDRGAWSIGIQYLGYGTMSQTEADGSVVGTFSPQDVVFSGMYAHDFTDRLRGGINVKMIYSSYEQYTAFAMATDLGLNYYDPDHDMSLSLVLKNLGGQIKRFDNDYDRLPFDIQLGWMQRLGSSPFQLSITAWHLNKWNLPYYDMEDNGSEIRVLKQSFISNLFRHLVFGLQYAPSDKFYIALGYNYKTRTDMSTYNRNILSGFSIGAGLKVKSFALGVSYAQPHKSGSSIMLNLSTNLNELLRR
ncbi:MAG: type IX secretion system protein PorQ [Muribaculaceae bacterium]|nr:type IX secretion system protein PorQ [Muribaculaceae bacterium]